MKPLMDNLKRYEVESDEEWMAWMEKIPFIRFPVGWEIRMVPPFAGAMVRFHVKTALIQPSDRISVYLDVYDRLGYCEGPYWEAYPIDDTTFRCGMDDVVGLITAIDGEIVKLEKKGM